MAKIIKTQNYNMKILLKIIFITLIIFTTQQTKAQKMIEKIKKGKFTVTHLPDATEYYMHLNTGVKVRYLEIGQGEPLILIHTIRTQADYFYKLIPLLKNSFKIYAIDLPGHGYSDLAIDSYKEEYFRKAIIEFIENKQLKNVTLVGESIGGVLALTVASLKPNLVKKVYSLNPYDYGEKFGGGIRRSKNGWIISLFGFFKSWTIEPKFILKKALSGGFYDKNNLEKKFLKELNKVGHRKGYRKGEYNVFANWKSWIKAREIYKNISVPVTLIYGKSDWSNTTDRKNNQSVIKNASLIELHGTNHFSALENSQKIAIIILK